MSFEVSFEPVIGLEIHVQLKSSTKLFCRARNFFTDEPNINVDFYTFALPGTLPVLNKEPLEKAIILASALNCKINKVSFFDRKHYFYPDLPKGYQITQFFKPFAQMGNFSYPSENGLKEVTIKSIVLEEDAGKSIHDTALGCSLIDLNRAGVPLVEIVTDPCFSSPSEASGFLKALRNLVRFLDLSEGDLEKGSLRCDANVSVRQTGTMSLGTRVEIKNINSFKFLEAALEYEIARQIKQLREGKSVKKETRGYDSEKNITYSLRIKEEYSDYRFMPEPDLPPLVISEQLIERLKALAHPNPTDIYKTLVRDVGLSPSEALFISSTKPFAMLMLKGVERKKSSKILASLIINDIQGILNSLKKSADQIALPEEQIFELVDLLEADKLTRKNCREILAEIISSEKASVTEIIESRQLLHSSLSNEVLDYIDLVLKENSDIVKEILKGRDKKKAALVGLVLQKFNSANPREVSKVLDQKLEQLKSTI